MYFNKSLEDQFGNNMAPGWVLVSKKTLPDNRCQIYSHQLEMAKAQENFHMPCVLEAMVLNLMVYVFTGEQLYGEGTYIRCIERVHGEYPACVGDFGSAGLDVSPDFFLLDPYDYDEEAPYHVAWTCRKFSNSS
jgi:hypothetical protein